jgi:hypothetical protein
MNLPFHERRTRGTFARMKGNKVLPILLILLGAASASLSAQTLGQFAGASAAADGEGSVFMLAGNDAFRTGVSTRFNISRVSDFGLQLGLDRSCGESFFGGGIDLKIVILESAARFPVNLALDASFGSLNAAAAGRFRFGFGILASGRIASGARRAIEPYCSLIAEIEQIDMKHGSAALERCLSPGSNDETDARALVRAGVKIPVSDEAQILIEADLGRSSLFGAGFNIIF